MPWSRLWRPMLRLTGVSALRIFSRSVGYPMAPSGTYSTVILGLSNVWQGGCQKCWLRPTKQSECAVFAHSLSPTSTWAMHSWTPSSPWKTPTWASSPPKVDKTASSGSAKVQEQEKIDGHELLWQCGLDWNQHYAPIGTSNILCERPDHVPEEVQGEETRHDQEWMVSSHGQLQPAHCQGYEGVPPCQVH